VEVKTQTARQWKEEMEDKPCYRPALPFYDVCLNRNQPVKRFDCDKCAEEHGLVDFIE